MKFTIYGGITIKAKVYSEDNNIIELCVIDSGVGIKEEDLNKLFKAFGKIDNQDRNILNPYGVGLGLLISN